MNQFSPLARTAIALATISASGVSQAAFVTGAGNITDVGSGTSLSSGILNLQPTNASALILTASSGTFSTITSPSGFAGFPQISFLNTLNLNGIVTYSGSAGPYTAQAVSNLFTVGTYHFNLYSLAKNINGSGSPTSVFAKGEWVDTSGVLAVTGGDLSFTTTDPANWSSFAGTLSATGAAPSAVPLPAAAWLLLVGLGGLGAVGRRKREST